MRACKIEIRSGRSLVALVSLQGSTPGAWRTHWASPDNSQPLVEVLSSSSDAGGSSFILGGTIAFHASNIGYFCGCGRHIVVCLQQLRRWDQKTPGSKHGQYEIIDFEMSSFGRQIKFLEFTCVKYLQGYRLNPIEEQ